MSQDKIIIFGLWDNNLIYDGTVEEAKMMIEIVRQKCVNNKQFMRHNYISFNDLKYKLVSDYIKQNCHENTFQVSVYGGSYWRIKANSEKEILDNIKNQCVKQIEDLEFYPENLSLWKKEYAQAKFFNQEKQFLEQHPKPILPKLEVEFSGAIIPIRDFGVTLNCDINNPNLSIQLSLACDAARKDLDSKIHNIRIVTTEHEVQERIKEWESNWDKFKSIIDNEK